MSRWVVYSLVAVVLIAVIAAGGGAYVWLGGDVPFGGRAPGEPRMDYAEMDAIPSPVYLFDWAWVARHDLEVDRSRLLPPGVEGPATEPAFDVFYIHPTTYWGEEWNSGGTDPEVALAVEGPLMALEASAFNGCCRVFAPRYRQAHGAAYVNSSGNGRTAFDLANVDVERAFNHYITMENKGRPFFLVGHGQGAQQIMRLIDRRVEAGAGSVDENYEKFVAAYLIGTGVPTERFGTAWKRIVPCETAEDVGCIVSWEAYAEGSDPSLSLNLTEVWFSRHWTQLAEAERNCTNPLTWSTDGEPATADANLGSLLIGTGVVPGATPIVSPSDFDTLPELVPGYVGAECRDGYLFVDLPEGTPVQGFGRDGGNLDAYAITLFWANIRSNLETRAEAYFSREAEIEAVKAENRARMEAEIAAREAEAEAAAREAEAAANQAAGQN